MSLLYLLLLIFSYLFNREISQLYPNNGIGNIEKSGKSSVIHILLAEEQTTKILTKLRFAKIHPREKSTCSQFAKINSQKMLKRTTHENKSFRKFLS